jgi:hypothetical protein
MKIDGTLPLTPWSDRAVSGQPAPKQQSSGMMEAGPDAEEVAQKPMDSKELAPSTGTYSPASLKAAASKNALYPEVAENNLNAINHPSPIPRLILDRLNRLLSQK